MDWPVDGDCVAASTAAARRTGIVGGALKGIVACRVACTSAWREKQANAGLESYHLSTCLRFEGFDSLNSPTESCSGHRRAAIRVDLGSPRQTFRGSLASGAGSSLQRWGWPLAETTTITIKVKRVGD